MKSQLLNEFAGVHGELGSAPPNCTRISPLLPGEKERRQGQAKGGERDKEGRDGRREEGLLHRIRRGICIYNTSRDPVIAEETGEAG